MVRVTEVPGAFRGLKEFPRRCLGTLQEMLELYTLPGCPFCARVKHKLDELDLEYERRVVPAFRFQRDEVKEISGQTGVPVLVDPTNGVVGMPESRDIIAYLEQTYA